MIRKDDINSSTSVEITLSIYGVLKVDDFVASRISIKDDIFSVMTASNVTYMFSAVYDNHYFILTSFTDAIYTGFQNALRLSKYPASWVMGKPTVYSYDTKTWIPLNKPMFSKKVGSILSDGSPLFDDVYVYDYLTVETLSVKPFNTDFDAVYFRLNSDNPVIK